MLSQTIPTDEGKRRTLRKAQRNKMKTRNSKSGFFNPRILCAFALCSVGTLLAMLSFAAMPPVDTTRANTSLPTDPPSFPSTFGSNTNQLPVGVPLPPGARFAPNSQGDASSSSPTAGLPEFSGMPVRPATATGATSAGSPAFATVSQPGAGAWSIVTSPNASTTEASNALYGTTCLSASDCWAVGFFSSSADGTLQTLIERWNGTSWTIVSSPNTDTTEANFLTGVTCTSASNCWAVGYANTGFAQPRITQTLIERWNGTSWSIVSSPNTSPTQSNVLNGVTCVSASECWAVGSYLLDAQTPQTLIEQWDGTSWTIVTSGNTKTDPTAAQWNQLYAVTCVSASDCWAVGNYRTGDGFVVQTLIEHWDGASWAIVTSANNDTTEDNRLYAVTCVSASNCWAVGSSFRFPTTLTLIERWDGNSWAIVASPNASADPDTASYLTGVTCASASDCWAVGNYYIHSTNRTGTAAYPTLIERWDGNSWAIVDSPNAPDRYHYLLGVTCVSASNCWTVGYNYSDGGYIHQTSIERWDGTSWAIVTSPNTGRAQYSLNSYITSVRCVSASDCWAVGYYASNRGIETLIERWDGTSWAIVDSPNVDPVNLNYLFSVTCVSASECWAVGYVVDSNSAVIKTLIERWDGSSWAIVTSPNVSSPSDAIAPPQSLLYNVTCVSASNCWAVGYYYPTFSSIAQTLVERWDGTSWTVVTSPNTSPTQHNLLLGVACASASECWAIGYYYNGGGSFYQTLIERWDGTSWTIVTSPNTSATQNNYLNAVTCASASDCWAVGEYYTGTFYQTLVEHWGGTSWTIVSSPNTSEGQASNFLQGVTCASSSECWAVGYYYYSSGSFYQTLIERWDGTAWAIVSSPNASDSARDILFGVTCAPASDCWGIGVSLINASGLYETLTEHFTLPSVPLNAVVSRKVHGTAGTFDVDLPLDGSGIECRRGGANGDYTLVFRFANTLTSVGGASVTAGTGLVSTNNMDSNDAHNYIVNLTGVTNAQRITVSLTNVTDSVGNFSANIPVSMGVLNGDVNSNAVVSNTDVAVLTSQVAAPVTSSNFRSDVNANGVISNTDVSTTKAQVGTSLP
jgi:hypothetical protein